MESLNRSMTFRLFAPEDAAPLTELLHRAYAELAERGLNYTATYQDAATTLARAQGGRCWIVENGAGSMVGTLTMSLPPAAGIQKLTEQARVTARAWLNQLAISPTEQRSGIASQLWGLGQQWALERGATSVGIDTAVPAEHLMRLYSLWGFAARDTIHWRGNRGCVGSRCIWPKRSYHVFVGGKDANSARRSDRTRRVISRLGRSRLGLWR